MICLYIHLGFLLEKANVLNQIGSVKKYSCKKQSKVPFIIEKYLDVTVFEL